MTVIIILILSVLIPAYIMSRIPGVSGNFQKYFLVFAGSYLFSITIIHILPELYQSEQIGKVSLAILAGFFFQQILEFFSAGIEHGHIHRIKLQNGISRKVFTLLLAMCVHSLLEGTLLIQPGPTHEVIDRSVVLTGIVFHKIPASIALMSILSVSVTKPGVLWTCMLIFALASPVGFIISDVTFSSEGLSSDIFTMLLAFVGGNFLHISTTIVFETSLDHKFDLLKFMTAIGGALVAVLVEIHVQV